MAVGSGPAIGQSTDAQSALSVPLPPPAPPIPVTADYSAKPIPAKPVPLDPVELGYAREVVEVLFPEEQRLTIMTGLMRTISQQMRSAGFSETSDPGLRQLLNAFIDDMPRRLSPIFARNAPRMGEAMATAYVNEFSRSELKQIRDFAVTPAGRHYLEASMKMLDDPAIATTNRAIFREIESAAEAAKADLRKDVDAYLAKHPEVRLRDGR